MQRVWEPEAVRFEVRVSPALALLHILPLLDLAARYPGVDPWLARLSRSLGREARADFRLITVPLLGALRIFLRTPDTSESCQAGFDALAAAAPTDLQGMALDYIAGNTGLDGAGSAARLLRRDPERFRELLKTLDPPTRDEAYPIDWDRAVGLLGCPEALKALLVRRLGSLWQEHMARAWRQRMDTMEWAAQQSRRHLGRGSVDAVFRAVTGREPGEPLRALAVKAGRVVFCPNPFLGPYHSTVGDEVGPDGRPGLWVGYGVPAGAALPAAGGEDAALPGGLPAVLAALADGGRLRVLALAAQRGEVTAAEIMDALGWTQPTTSVIDRADRRLLLMTTDLVRAAAMGAVAAPAFQDVLQVWQVVLFGVVEGVAQTFHGPALQASIPRLVPPSALNQAHPRPPRPWPPLASAWR